MLGRREVGQDEVHVGMAVRQEGERLDAVAGLHDREAALLERPRRHRRTSGLSSTTITISPRPAADDRSEIAGPRGDVSVVTGR